tara:strand:+ start:486 stop:860 length:375 start_codon:yes stop_codon:yes gene_type:complete
VASVKKVSAEIAEAKAARTTCDREAHAGKVLKDAFTGILENDIGDLTMRQMAIFMHVSEANGLSMSDIAKLLNISMSSISRSVDALENKKVIRRKRDGKYVRLFLRPRGEAMIGRALSSITRHL